MEEEKYLVSMIIPVYNVEKYLKRCIDSVRKQSYPHLEIILVDDGSTDGSHDLCKKYEKKDSRIHVLQKENGGLMSAWIHGVKASKGEYLCFVDSDDWVDFTMVENLIKECTGNRKELICSNYIIENEDKKESVPVIQSMKPGIYEKEEVCKIIIPEILGNEIRRIHSSRCMKLISRSLITENIRFTNQEITMGEDLNIMFPVILDAERIVIVEEGYYYHYRSVGSSIAHQYNPKLYEKVRLLYYTLQEIMEQKEKKELAENLKQEYIFLLFLVIKSELRGPSKGVYSRIRKLIDKAKAEGLQDTRVEVNTKANRLLYQIWKQPNIVTVGAAKAAIWLFDRR